MMYILSLLNADSIGRVNCNSMLEPTLFHRQTINIRQHPLLTIMEHDEQGEGGGGEVDLHAVGQGSVAVGGADGTI